MERIKLWHVNDSQDDDLWIYIDPEQVAYFAYIPGKMVVSGLPINDETEAKLRSLAPQIYVLYQSMNNTEDSNNIFDGVKKLLIDTFPDFTPKIENSHLEYLDRDDYTVYLIPYKESDYDDYTLTVDDREDVLQVWDRHSGWQGNGRKYEFFESQLGNGIEKSVMIDDKAMVDLNENNVVFPTVQEDEFLYVSDGRSTVINAEKFAHLYAKFR